MTRWPTDAAERLRAAAFELFEADGFADVTAQQIADRAGVSERTFFRYFATKEEVLFGDGEAILAEIVSALHSSPADARPRQVFDAVALRLAALFEPERAFHRTRNAVIHADASLHERDLWKQEVWANVIANALIDRGLPPTRASVVSSAAVTSFRIVYASWSTDRSRTRLLARFSLAIAELRDDLL